MADSWRAEQQAPHSRLPLPNPAMRCAALSRRLSHLPTSPAPRASSQRLARYAHRPGPSRPSSCRRPRCDSAATAQGRREDRSPGMVSTWAQPSCHQRLVHRALDQRGNGCVPLRLAHAADGIDPSGANRQRRLPHRRCRPADHSARSGRGSPRGLPELAGARRSRSATRGLAPGLPPEEGAIGKAQAGGIAMPPGWQTRCAAPSRKQTGDRRSCPVQHFAISRCLVRPPSVKKLK
jgi:hypothetical protein